MTDPASGAKPRGLRTAAFEGLIWGAGFTLVRDVIQFASMIVLVRLIDPETYGHQALAMSIIGVIGALSFRTLSSFALQARDPESFDWPTHFTAGMVLNAILFALASGGAYVCLSLDLWAPREIYLSIFVMLAGFLLEPIALQHNVHLSAFHRWKRLRVLMLLSALTSAAAGIGLGAAGYGIFALAAMSPAQHIPFLIDVFRSRAAHVTFRFRGLKSYKTGLQFGLVRSASSSVAVGAQFAENAIVSAQFGFLTLGYYGRASGLASLASGRFGPLMADFLFPVLTRAEAGSERFQRFARMIATASTWVSVAAAVFLVQERELIVSVLYGSGWTAVTQYIPLMTVFIFLTSAQFVYQRILLANNQYGDVLKIDLTAAPTRILTILIAAPFGVQILLLGLSLHALCVLVGTIMIGLRGGAFGGWRDFREIAPSILAGTVGALALTLAPSFGPAGMLVDILEIVVKFAVFSVAYLLTLLALSADPISELVENTRLSGLHRKISAARGDLSAFFKRRLHVLRRQP